jgi:hypothetical protein
MQIDFNDSVHTPAEREGLLWLSGLDNWLKASVRRVSSREFDFMVAGERAHTRPWQQARFFETHFVLLCLREFWSMKLITAPLGSWSMIEQRHHDENWKVFDNVLEQHRLKQSMQPMFSQRFLGDCRKVWGALAEESLEVGSNDEAIELILDADRLAMYGSEESNEELKRLDDAHGYAKVQAELSRVLRFV